MGRRKLKRVVLMSGMEWLITKEVFCELSSRQGLEVWGIGGVVTKEFVVSGALWVVLGVNGWMDRRM